MKTTIPFFLILIVVNLNVFCQDSEGMFCGLEGEKPIWILRFELIDSETHYPIRDAMISITDEYGKEMKWPAHRDGFSILIVTDPVCIPYDGKIEVTSKNYRYHQEPIRRNYFESGEDSKRIYLEGHDHNWTNMKELPETQEIFDKIRDKRYRVGVLEVSYGCDWRLTNYAPACFEYSIQMERISSGNYYPDHNNNRPSGRYGSNLKEFQIPTVNYNGETLYVFPNDLPGGHFHWEQAKNECRRLNRLGYDDWYLPSKEELNILYMNKDRIGGFNGWYWSSTESSNNRAWGQNFNNGIQETTSKGTMYDIHKGNVNVRCIRKD
jgi:hypothetical protein